MSRFTREERDEMTRCKARPVVGISIQREKRAMLEAETQEFLARGGQIRHIPTGESGARLGKTAAEMAAKGGRAYSKITKGTLGVTAAAKLLGITRPALTRKVNLGEGPSYYMVGEQRRFLESDLVLWKARQEQPVAMEQTA